MVSRWITANLRLTKRKQEYMALQNHWLDIELFVIDWNSLLVVTIATTLLVSSFIVYIVGNIQLFCIVIYRPPKSNANFISDFSELLSLIVPKYDNVDTWQH